MNAIATHFNKATDELLTLAKQQGTNIIPNGLSFVKCYDVKDALSNSFSLSIYEHTCFLERERFDSAQIIADLVFFQEHGPYISWVDLELYYITNIDVVILVKLIFSQKKGVMNYHICIPISEKNKNKSKFNLNDYANERR